MNVKTTAKILTGCCALTIPTLALSQLEEVIVTATLREQSLQEVSMAISAFSEAQLEESRVENFLDLSEIAPNISFTSATGMGFATPTIRGVGAVGASSSGISSSPATTIYIDGVYLGSAAANTFSALDVERIEILRGPQGTLYGRNALAGVINMITARPTDTPTGKFRLGYGNYNQVEGFGSISGPLVEDKLLGRLAVSYLDRDGYIENAYTNPNPLQDESTQDAESLESTSVRGTVDFLATDALVFKLTGFHSEQQGTNFGGDIISGSTPFGYTGTPGFHTGAYNENNTTIVTNYGGALTIEWDHEDFRVISITGYENSEYLDEGADVDQTPEELFSQWLLVEEDGLSQELRLHMETDKASWVFGANYYESSARQEDTTDLFGALRQFGIPGALITRSLFQSETESFGVFGNVDLALTDQLTLTLGARWTTSDRLLERLISRIEEGGLEYTGAVPLGAVPDDVVLTTLAAPTRPSDTFSKFTPRVAVNYAVNDETFVYASYSLGYRDGGFATRSTIPNSSFDPEELAAYEIGLKTTALDGRLRLNSAAYFYDYTDQQVEDLRIDPVTGAQLIDVINSGNSEAYGLEVDFTAQITDAFDIDGHLGLQHTELKEFIFNGVDEAGNEFPRAPELTSMLAANYSVDTESLGTVHVRGEWTYTAKEFIAVDNIARDTSESRSLFNLNASISPSPSWTVSVWGRNLADEEYFTSRGEFPIGPYYFGTKGEPRTYGATVEYRFGDI